jgi:ubiquinone/menaquinone biosynthesis C-methylase UbiE
MHIVLNLGCSNSSVPKGIYPPGEWKEIKVDADKDCRCDVLADLQKLPFKDGMADSVYMSHVFEHFDYRSRHTLLKECKRVLRVKGNLVIIVPDITCTPVLKALTEGDLQRVLYISPAGPITAEQVIFGQFYAGEYMIHRSGYNEKSLRAVLQPYFEYIRTGKQEEFSCFAVSRK